MSANYQRQGDWILKNISLENFQGDEIKLLDQFGYLEYTEDLFNNVTHGKMTLIDGNDLVQYFPIIGEETLRFSYVTADEFEPVNKEFYVYRVGNKKDENNTMISYTIYFTSVESMVDQNTSISKSFKNKKASEIVQNVFDTLESDKEIQIDDTLNLHHIIVPNWSPFQTINWATSIARSPNHDGSMFLFYENVDGFNFRHIESIIEEEAQFDFSQKLASLDPNKVDSSDATYPFQSITSYKIIKTTDKLDSLSEGMFGARTIAYDNVAKTIRTNDFEYDSGFDQTSHMSSHKLVSDSFEYNDPTQRIMTIPTKTYREESSYYQDSGIDEKSQRMEEIVGFRSSLLSQISSNQIEANAFGDSRITCGMMINVELENKTAIEDKRTRLGEKYINEKMLIGKCKHSFTKTKHTMTMLLMKDSLSSRPEFDL